MKTDPSPITQQAIVWRSSNRPPWLDVWSGCCTHRWARRPGITLDGRKCRTRSSFFDEVARVLQISPSDIDHDWEVFIPWFIRLLDDPHFGTGIGVLDADALFLDERDYATEMGRFLHLFVRMNRRSTADEYDGGSGWVQPARMTLYLGCPNEVGDLLLDKVMEGMTEAF